MIEIDDDHSDRRGMPADELIHKRLRQLSKRMGCADSLQVRKGRRDRDVSWLIEGLAFQAQRELQFAGLKTGSLNRWNRTCVRRISVQTSGAAAIPPSFVKPLTRLWNRFRDQLWGYDFFISYHWDSGAQYAVNLGQRLRNEKFDVFLDRAEYAMGDDWKEIGLIALTNTQRLILIATREAVTISAPVEREVRLFRGRSKQVIPITFGQLDDIDWAENHTLKYISKDHLQINEHPENLKSAPSDSVISQLTRTHKITRRRTLRRWLLFSFGIAIIFAGIFVEVKREEASADRDKAFESARVAQTQESLVLARMSEEKRRSGDSTGAIRDALTALPSYDLPEGLRRPYVVEAESALLRAVVDQRARSMTNTKHFGSVPPRLVSSPDGRFVTLIFPEEAGDSDAKPSITVVIDAAGRRSAIFESATSAGFIDNETLMTNRDGLQFWRFVKDSWRLDRDFQGSEGRSIDLFGYDTVERWKIGAKSRRISKSPLSGCSLISRDGSIVTKDLEGSLQITSRLTQRTVETPKLSGRADMGCEARFSPDGRSLAVHTARSRSLVVFDVATGKAIFEKNEYPGEVYEATFSNNGKLLAAGYGQGRVDMNVTVARVFDARSGDVIATFGGHDGTVQGVLFSPDDEFLITLSRDGTAAIWSLVTQQQVARLIGGGDPLERASFSDDGSVVATVSDHGLVETWLLDPRTKMAKKFSLQNQEVRFGADDSVVVFQNRADGIGQESFCTRVLDHASNRTLFVAEGNGSYCSDDGRFVGTVGSGGVLRIDQLGPTGGVRRIDLERYGLHIDSRVNENLYAEQNKVVRFSKSNDFIAARSRDKETGKALNAVFDMRPEVPALVLSTEGLFFFDPLDEWLGAIVDDQHIHLIDRHGKEEKQFAHEEKDKESVRLEFGPKGNYLVIKGSGGNVLIRVSDGEERRLSEPYPLAGTLINRAGSLALSADVNGIEVIDLRTMEPISPHLEIEELTYASFSPGGRYIVGCDYGALHVWDALSREKKYIIPQKGLAGAQLFPVFSEDDRLMSVTTGWNDGLDEAWYINNRSAQIWDAESGVLLRTIAGDSGLLDSVAFSSNGYFIAVEFSSEHDFSDKESTDEKISVESWMWPSYTKKDLRIFAESLIPRVQVIE